MKIFLQIVLAVGLMGAMDLYAHGNAESAQTRLVFVDDDCELNSEEVLAIQAALAEYLHKQLSEIQAHMSGIVVTACDETGWAVGTITLSYTGQPNVSYNWTRESGVELIILIDEE